MRNPVRLPLLGLATCAWLALTGCATPARTDQMTISATAVSALQVPQALRTAVAVRDVTGGQDTNPLWMSSVGSAEFERALEGSLRAAGLLSENRQGSRFFLTAHLQKLDRPFAGLDMTVTAHVAYTLTERASGRDVYDSVLVTPYTARVSDALLAVERLKLANEGAIRASIARLVEELTRLDPDRPAAR